MQSILYKRYISNNSSSYVSNDINVLRIPIYKIFRINKGFYKSISGYFKITLYMKLYFITLHQVIYFRFIQSVISLFMKYLIFFFFVYIYIWLLQK